MLNSNKLDPPNPIKNKKNSILANKIKGKEETAMMMQKSNKLDYTNKKKKVLIEHDDSNSNSHSPSSLFNTAK